MKRSLNIVLTLLAGVSLIGSPASAAVVAAEHVTGLAGGLAGGAVGGPVGGFVGGIAGRLIGRALPKKKQINLQPPAPAQAGPLTPLRPERLLDPSINDRTVDATPIREIEVDRGQPDALSAGQPVLANASAPSDAQAASASPAPGTLDYQLSRVRAGLPTDDGAN